MTEMNVIEYEKAERIAIKHIKIAWKNGALLGAILGLIVGVVAGIVFS